MMDNHNKSTTTDNQRKPTMRANQGKSEMKPNHFSCIELNAFVWDMLANRECKGN